MIFLVFCVVWLIGFFSRMCLFVFVSGLMIEWWMLGGVVMMIIWMVGLVVMVDRFDVKVGVMFV